MIKGGVKFTTEHFADSRRKHTLLRGTAGGENKEHYQGRGGGVIKLIILTDGEKLND